MAPVAELLGRLPEKRRGRVGEFLEAQHIVQVEDFRAVLPQDLDQALVTAAALPLGHRAAVRGLHAQELSRSREAGGLGRRCTSCTRPLLPYVALVVLGLLCEQCRIWDPLTKWDVHCNNPISHPGSAGNITSGVLVLVAGLPKTGTRSLSRALYQLGFFQMYHSEDLGRFVWSDFADNSGPDPGVLQGKTPGQLAAALARCSTDGVAFDGMEGLFWPIYHVSPNAKVISLNRLTFDEHVGSTSGVRRRLMQATVVVGLLLSSAQHLLPWSRLLQAVDEIFLASELAGRLSLGGPPLSQGGDFYSALLRAFADNRPILSRWREALSPEPAAEAQDGLREDVRAAVPGRRLLEWDARRHGWEELCGFLGVQKCPQTGVLPRVSEPEFPWHFIGALPVWALMHYLHRRILWPVLRPVIRIILKLVFQPVLWAWAALVHLFQWWGSAWRSCKGILIFKFVFLVHCGNIFDWQYFTDLDIPCKYPPLPGNQSGLKVLVAGLAKTGTRTLSRSLHDIGFTRSYHSEEFNFHVWSDIYWDHWKRNTPEVVSTNATGNTSTALSMLSQNYEPIGNWSSTAASTVGVDVLAATPPWLLAQRISRCRVDAVALDGMESLFWPVYHASPDVKVIAMSWRTYDEYLQSAAFFVPALGAALMFLSIFTNSINVLPWQMVVNLLDRLSGRQLERMLQEGGPPFCQVYPPFVALYHGAVNSRRVFIHWTMGLGYHVRTREDYEEFWDGLRRVVPESRLMEWDMKKHTWEDLCRFVGVSECKRTGRLPRAINLLNFERDFPLTFWMRVPLFLLLHRINWIVVGFLFSVASSAVTRVSRTVREEASRRVREGMWRTKPSGGPG